MSPKASLSCPLTLAVCVNIQPRPLLSSHSRALRAPGRSQAPHGIVHFASPIRFAASAESVVSSLSLETLAKVLKRFRRHRDLPANNPYGLWYAYKRSIHKWSGHSSEPPTCYLGSWICKQALRTPRVPKTPGPRQRGLLAVFRCVKHARGRSTRSPALPPQPHAMYLDQRRHDANISSLHGPAEP